MPKKVVVVTGSADDEGLGYAIVKGICQRTNSWVVYLTAGDKDQGLAAVKNLKDLGLKPQFHLLDITVPESVQKLRDYILKKYGGLDGLVNYAGTSFIQALVTQPFAVRARETMRVNYFAFRDACNILFPILKPHSIVMNVSSNSYGHLDLIPGQHLRDILASPDLTEEKLSELIFSFVIAAENGTYVQEGWSKNNSYAVSKIALSVLSRIQQNELQKDEANRPGIELLYVHPQLERVHTKPKEQDIASLLTQVLKHPPSTSSTQTKPEEQKDVSPPKKNPPFTSSSHPKT